MYTLLYVKQVTKKDLLYSTGNSVMTYMGEGSLKKGDICISDSLAIRLRLTKHCKSTILQ